MDKPPPESSNSATSVEEMLVGLKDPQIAPSTTWQNPQSRRAVPNLTQSGLSPTVTYWVAGWFARTSFGQLKVFLYSLPKLLPHPGFYFRDYRSCSPSGLLVLVAASKDFCANQAWNWSLWTWSTQHQQPPTGRAKNSSRNGSWRPDRQCPPLAAPTSPSHLVQVYLVCPTAYPPFDPTHHQVGIRWHLWLSRHPSLVIWPQSWSPPFGPRLPGTNVQ